MTNGMQSRLDELEILYSEQDYTIQTLNSLVAEQDKQITLLTRNLEDLRQQLQALRTELGGDIDPGFEIPPHY